MRKGQVVASRWSVCHLNTLWPLLGAFFLVTIHAAEGLYPTSQAPVGKSTPTPLALPLCPNKHKKDKHGHNGQWKGKIQDYAVL